MNLLFKPIIHPNIIHHLNRSLYNIVFHTFDCNIVVSKFELFKNDPVDLGSITGCIIPKTLKMVLDTSLLNTWQYKVCIKGKVSQSRERSSALPYTSV